MPAMPDFPAGNVAGQLPRSLGAAPMSNWAALVMSIMAQVQEGDSATEFSRGFERMCVDLGVERQGTAMWWSLTTWCPAVALPAVAAGHRTLVIGLRAPWSSSPHLLKPSAEIQGHSWSSGVHHVHHVHHYH